MAAEGLGLNFCSLQEIFEVFLCAEMSVLDSRYITSEGPVCNAKTFHTEYVIA